MEIEVIIKEILPVQTFTSKRDGQTFNRYSFIGRTMDNYPKNIKFDVLGDDKWGSMGVTVGKKYSVAFDVESRQWNDKWFTGVSAWKAVPFEKESAPAQQYVGVPQQPAQQPAYSGQVERDELPF